MATIKTTFCLVSDTHDRDPMPADAEQHAFREPVPAANVLLHAGDLTMEGGLENHKRVLQSIMAAEAELKIVIAGNHDVGRSISEILCDSAVSLSKATNFQSSIGINWESRSHPMTIRSS